MAQEQGDHVNLLAESRKAVEVVGAQAERIAIRLGENSPIFSGYEQARIALWKLHHGLIADNALRKLPGFDEEPRPDPAANPALIEGRRRFREAASSLVGPSVGRSHLQNRLRAPEREPQR